MATPRVTIDALPIQAVPEDTNEIIVQDSGVTKRMTIAALASVPSPALSAHLADVDDAHDATAISTTPSGSGVDGTNVQVQLGQLADQLTAGAVDISDHLANPSDAHDATAISAVPFPGVTGTDVQTQLQELGTAIAVKDVVWVGPDAPTDPVVEMWWDSNEPSAYIPTVVTPIVVNVRDYGAIADGATNNDAAIAAAIAAVPAWGGTIYFPANASGGYKFTTGIVIDGKRVSICGDGPACTYLDYYGSGTAITLTEPNCTLEGFNLRNQGGTGLKGIVCGKTNATTLGRDNVRHVWINSFTTVGLHVSNRELSEFDDVQVSGNGVTATGILVDDSLSTNPTNKTSMGLVFRRCRGIQCTTTGWDVNFMIAALFECCQAWGSTGTYQFTLGITTFNCTIHALDVESAGDATKHGVNFQGNNNTITVNAYSLDRAIHMQNAVGCHVGPSRFNTVTTTVYRGSNTACLVFDGGNLGVMPDATPDENMLYGRIGRTKNLELRGTGGAGYLDFVNKQTTAPAGSANRARIFTKDNGSGKTQLMVVFGTGAAVQIAIEP